MFKGELSISKIQSAHSKSNHKLDGLIEPLGLKQNSSKQETIAMLHGEGAGSIYRQLRDTSSQVPILNYMLYLGVWMSGDLSNKREITSRLAAAWKRWKIFSPLWFANSPSLRIRKLFFCPLFIILGSLRWKPSCCPQQSMISLLNS